MDCRVCNAVIAELFVRIEDIFCSYKNFLEIVFLTKTGHARERENWSRS